MVSSRVGKPSCQQGTVDAAGARWSASATFVADHSGAIDTARQAPTAGSYSGIDAAGVLWSMRANPQQKYFALPATGQYHVSIAARENGHTVATRSLTRTFRLSTARVTQLRPQTNSGLFGTFYAPANATAHPAVLTFGGSEGGQSQNEIAGLLASRGYPTLSLAYFAEPGLPKQLADIPLEYFATAARWLAAAPDPGGSDRGSFDHHLRTAGPGVAVLWLQPGDHRRPRWQLGSRPALVLRGRRAHFIGGLVQDQPLGTFKRLGGNDFDLEKGLRDAWRRVLAALGKPTRPEQKVSGG